MPAACGQCGQTVMPYRKYLFHLGPTAVCEGCGVRVRLSRWNTVMVGLFVTGVGIVPVLRFVDSTTTSLVILLVVAAGLLALDRWSWNTWEWTPAGGSVGDDPSEKP